MYQNLNCCNISTIHGTIVVLWLKYLQTFPSRLHYNLKKFWGKSTCVDINGEPTVELGMDRLWMEAAGRLGNSIFNFIAGFALAKTNNQELMVTPRLAYYIQETF